MNVSFVQSVTIAVLANDSDPDGDTLRLVSASRPSKGTVTVTINADGTLTYVPGRRFKTGDTFSYTISDGTYSATGFVTVSTP